MSEHPYEVYVKTALDQIAETYQDVAQREQILYDEVVRLTALAERERSARKAVERVNADEVLSKRTNLNVIIESERVRADDAEARATELERKAGQYRSAMNAQVELREAAEQRAERAEAALRDALALIEKTIYHPPGWTGPDVWWADEARTLLARREARDER